MTIGRVLSIALHILIVFVALLFALNPLVVRDLWLRVSSDLHPESAWVVQQETIGEWQVYDASPGLDRIAVIERDAAGQMWVAGGRTVFRFDGERGYDCKSGVLAAWPFQVRGLAVSERFACIGLGELDHDGGVAIYDRERKRWSLFLVGGGELGRGGVRGVAIDPQGRVYMPTSGGLLDILEGEEWAHLPLPHPFGEKPPLNYDGVFDDRGTYWLATDWGIWQYDGSTWTPKATPGLVTSLAVDTAGRLWAGMDGGLVVHESGRWYHYRPECYSSGTGWISDVAVDGEGRVWVVTRAGLAAFNGRDWQTFTPEVVGEPFWGEALACDERGRPWVALPGGRIAVFQGQVEIGPFDGLVDPPPMGDLPEIRLSSTAVAPRMALHAGIVIARNVASTVLGLAVVVGIVRIGAAVRRALR